MTQSSDKPLRIDAARNRARILTAAQAAFAEKGTEATLHDVARVAGVGVGTVYRRFPDKESLLAELLDAKLAHLTALAEEASVAEHPGDGLRTYLMQAMQARADDRALGDLLVRSGRDSASVAAARGRLVQLLDALIRVGQERGEVRAGMLSDDVPILIFMVGGVADRTRDIDEKAWLRYARIVIDGTRPLAGAALQEPGAGFFARAFEG